MLYFMLALLAVVAQCQTTPKNLIYMISDGYGVPEQTLTRLTMERLGLGEVFMDEILVGQAKTRSFESLVTESASAATSLSCGIKTLRGATGVDHEGNSCLTLLEALRDRGYKTGTVSTSRIQDATISAFTAHAESRFDYTTISIEQVYGGFDLLLGGGYDYLVSEEFHPDGRDIYVEAGTEQGFNTVRTAVDFRAADSLPLLGVFTDGHMSQEIDRREDEEPSILEMVQKAVTLLSEAAEEEDTGFMLLVEGSNIDKRWHECDAVGAQYDAIVYDQTLEWVTNFAKENGETLVISTSDHECGGIAIGNVWDTFRDNLYPEVFGQVDHSALYMARRILNDGVSVEDALREGLSRLDEPYNQTDIDFLTEQIARPATQAPEFATVDVPRLSNLISRITNQRLNVGCLAGTERLDHTGENVPIFGYGPGIERFWPVMDNTEIALTVADIFGVEIGVEAFGRVPTPEMTPDTNAAGPAVEEEEAVLLEPGLPSYGVALVMILGIAGIIGLACVWMYTQKKPQQPEHRPLASRSNSKEQADVTLESQ